MLGHSEGCIIAPQVSAMRPAIAGLILLWPFIDDMEAILLRQTMQIEENLTATHGNDRGQSATTHSQVEVIQLTNFQGWV